MKVEFKGVPIEKKYTEIIQQIQKENEDLTSKQEVEEEQKKKEAKKETKKGGK